MEAEIVALGKEIDRLERQEKLAAQMNAPTSDPILGKPANPEISEKTGIASNEYKTAFWNNVRNRNYVDLKRNLP